MTNTPIPVKEITGKLDNPRKQAIVDEIIQMEEYQALQNHREQIFFIYSQAEAYSIQHKSRIRLTYQDIGELFKVSYSTIRYHLEQYFKDLEKNTKKNGRPFSLDDEEIQKTKAWLDSREKPAKYPNLRQFCLNEFNKDLDYSTMIILLDKCGYMSVDAKPMEQPRYDAPFTQIEAFFQKLDEISKLKIPPSFVLNLDEEGHDTFVDAVERKIFVAKEKVHNEKGVFYYPVKRIPNRTTFLGCITANGDSLRPLIITKRKTVDSSLLLRGYTASKFQLAYSVKGYITKDIFNEWLKEVLVPYIQQMRDDCSYVGPGVIFLDGCTCHQTDYLDQVCVENNLMPVFFPAHTSNQLQPCDLGMFAVHKSNIRQLDCTDEDPNEQVNRLATIYDSWRKACTVKNITSAFRAMGAFPVLNMEKLHSQTPTYLCFSRDRALKLLNHELSDDQRQLLRKQFTGLSSKRMTVEEFNRTGKTWSAMSRSADSSPVKNTVLNVNNSQPASPTRD